jgi:hypothetical protein
MTPRTTVWLVVIAFLLLPAGLAAQRFDRFDRYDRARLRAEIHRELRQAAEERQRAGDGLRRELRHARDSYRHAWRGSGWDGYRDAMRETRRALRDAYRASFRDRW